MLHTTYAFAGCMRILANRRKQTIEAPTRPQIPDTDGPVLRPRHNSLSRDAHRAQDRRNMSIEYSGSDGSVRTFSGARSRQPGPVARSIPGELPRRNFRSAVD